jgi:hypothetical protein
MAVALVLAEHEFLSRANRPLVAGGAEGHAAEAITTDFETPILQEPFDH